MNNSSILNDVKEAIGIMPDYTVFDQTLIMHINSVFMILHQMGVGPDKTFQLSTPTGRCRDYNSGNFHSVSPPSEII